MSQFQFIDHQRLHYPVRQLCRVLSVVPSRYYALCYPVYAGGATPYRGRRASRRRAPRDHVLTVPTGTCKASAASTWV